MCFASTCELVSFFNDPVNLLDLRLIRFHDNHIEIQPAACPHALRLQKGTKRQHAPTSWQRNLSEGAF